MSQETNPSTPEQVMDALEDKLRYGYHGDALAILNAFAAQVRAEALEENRKRWEAALSQLDAVETERDLTATETWIRAMAVSALKGSH